MRSRVSFRSLVVLTTACLFTAGSACGLQARPDPYKNFKFRVVIDGTATGGFTEVSGLGIEVEAVEYREGSENIVRKIPGVARVGNVTLKRGYVGDSTLSDWISTATSGPENLDRKDITINVFDQAADTVRSFNLSDCFPIAWTLSPLTVEDQVPLTEELVLSCDFLDIR